MIQKLQITFRATLLFSLAILTLPCKGSEDKKYFLLGVQEKDTNLTSDTNAILQEEKQSDKHYYIASTQISDERLFNFVIQSLGTNNVQVVGSGLTTIELSFRNLSNKFTTIPIEKKKDYDKSIIEKVFSKVRKESYYMSKKQIKEFITTEKKNKKTKYQDLLDYPNQNKRVLLLENNNVVTQTIDKVFFTNKPDTQISNNNNNEINNPDSSNPSPPIEVPDKDSNSEHFYEKNSFKLFLFFAVIALVLGMIKHNAQGRHKKKKTRQKSSS